MREKMSEMQRQMQTFAQFVQNELARGLRSASEPAPRNALVRLTPPKVIRVQKSESPEKSKS